MCGKQQETVRENTGKKNAQNTQNTNKTHTHRNKAEGQHTQGAPTQFEAVMRVTKEEDGRCVQSGHHNDHHCRETRALPPPPSAICYFTHTSNFHHKYAHTHTYLRTLSFCFDSACLSLSLSYFLCFSFVAFFFALVRQNYYILITHALATLTARSKANANNNSN